MNRTYRDLTEHEMNAITAYAKKHGRTWKADLLTDWYYARVPGFIQSVRNTHGPDWLRSFRLPESK